MQISVTVAFHPKFYRVKRFGDSRVRMSFVRVRHSKTGEILLYSER